MWRRDFGFRFVKNFAESRTASAVLKPFVFWTEAFRFQDVPSWFGLAAGRGLRRPEAFRFLI
jgi:hypothetical protein